MSKWSVRVSRRPSGARNCVSMVGWVVVNGVGVLNVKVVCQGLKETLGCQELCIHGWLGCCQWSRCSQCQSGLSGSQGDPRVPGIVYPWLVGLLLLLLLFICSLAKAVSDVND